MDHLNIIDCQLESLTSFVDYASNFKILSKEECNDLIYEYRDNSTSAHQKILDHHLNLIIAVAESFGPQTEKLPDRINAGIIGFLKALEKFDTKRGYQLATYSTFWIARMIEINTGERSPEGYGLHDETNTNIS